jgi:2-keto-3-deoxy-6-phosphogluconate aldolase
MLMEGVITLIIVAALFYVAPGVMSSVATAAPTVCATTQPGLATAQTAINATAAGALNLASIGLIMLGIAIMIGGFMLIRGYRGGGQ